MAFYTALAVTLHMAEFLIPKPVPFLKIGLSNIIIVLLIMHCPVKIAVLVAYAKTLIGSIASGTLLSPTILLSLAGITLALILMISAKMGNLGFGLIGISVLGAIGHNLGQLIMVRLVLIKTNNVFYLLPLLLVLAIITGIITGSIAIGIYEKTKKNG